MYRQNLEFSDHKRGNTVEFSTIRSQGILISADVLVEIGDGHAPGQAPEDFGYQDRTTLQKHLTEAWEDVRYRWTELAPGLLSDKSSRPQNSAARDAWIEAAMGCLGFQSMSLAQGDSQAPSPPVALWLGGGNRVLPLLVVRSDQDLDQTSNSISGQLSPHTALQAYLNCSEYAWGIVTNGLRLRILRELARITTDSYLEFDLRGIMEPGDFPAFEILFRVAHFSRWPPHGKESTDCWLEQYHEQTITGGTVSPGLIAENIVDAMRFFWWGFQKHPDYADVWEEGEVRFLDPGSAFYRQLLTMIYRLIFLMVCELRDTPVCTNGTRVFSDAYYECYSISRLRKLVDQPTYASDDGCDLWEGVKQTFRLFSNPGLGGLIGIPPVYTEFFQSHELVELDRCKLFNRDFIEGFRLVSYVRQDGFCKRIDYSRLDILELGSLHETLWLGSNPLFPYKARWSAGARDTPSVLIHEVIKRCLDPIIEKRLAAAESVAEKEKALLSIKICDPAATSGRFLIAAARRLGTILATIRTGGTPPTGDQLRSALREVIRDCIYGVEADPFAVNFCRFALWVDSCDPGHPVVPLHDRIKVGNGLVGIDLLERLQTGIPTAAFDPVAGDDKKTASGARARNRRSLKRWKRGQEKIASILEAHAGYLWGSDPIKAAQASRSLTGAARIWTSSFFWTLSDRDDPAVPTNDQLADWLLEGNELNEASHVNARALSSTFRFFHWPLEFSEAKFDVVLSNPPWDTIELSREEFDSHCHRILGESWDAYDSKEREQAYRELKHEQACLRKFFRESGRFPLTGPHASNTYPVFVELTTRLLKPDGRACLIVPAGIATDQSTKDLFGYLVTAGTLSALVGFDNSCMIFPGLDHSKRFCILDLTGDETPSDQTDFVFRCTSPSEAHEQDRHFTLSVQDLKLFNPNTLTAPVLMTQVDAALNRKIYSRVKVLHNRVTGENPWGISFLPSLHMSNHRKLLRTHNEDGVVPLYEGKMIEQFDHRHASFAAALPKNRSHQAPTKTDAKMKEDPDFVARPRYWVAHELVKERCKGWKRPWLLGIRSKRKSDAERTVLAVVLPRVGIANSIHGIGFDDSLGGRHIACLLANLNSMVFDYLARQKVGSMDLGLFVLEQLPVLPPAHYQDADVDFIVERVLELVYTARDLKGFAEDCSYAGKPFRWDPDRRAVLCAELNAFFAFLYGLERDELRYVLDPQDINGPDFPGETFRVLKQKEIKESGEFRTQRLILAAWDTLSEEGIINGRISA